MTDRDILVALFLGGAAAMVGLAEYAARASSAVNGGITFVTVATAGWLGYRLNR